MPELRADEATGDIRNIYEAIEAALGVRLVNLVYRHLATVPGALEWAWSTIGPDFEEGVFAQRSRELVAGLPAFPAQSISLQSVGLSPVEAARVVETLDAYNRANPMNAVSLRVIGLALQAGRPAAAKTIGRPARQELPALLPMASLDEMTPPTLELMYRLAWLTTPLHHLTVCVLGHHYGAVDEHAETQ